MDNGLFGGMFDLNNDGEMSAFERAVEFEFLEEMEKEDCEDSWEDD